MADLRTTQQLVVEIFEVPFETNFLRTTQQLIAEIFSDSLTSTDGLSAFITGTGLVTAGLDRMCGLSAAVTGSATVTGSTDVVRSDLSAAVIGTGLTTASIGCIAEFGAAIAATGLVTADIRCLADELDPIRDDDSLVLTDTACENISTGGWPTLDKPVKTAGACRCECPEDSPCTPPEHFKQLIKESGKFKGVPIHEGYADGEAPEYIVIRDLGEVSTSPRGGCRQNGQSVIRVRYRGAKARVTEMALDFRKLVMQRQFCVPNYGWLKVRSVVRTGVNEHLDSALWEQVDNFQLMTMS